MSTPAQEILLVEDNPNDVELFLHTLRQSHLADAVVHIVRDGAQALEAISALGAHGDRIRLRVILLDLRLPKVDGLRVLQHIKSDPRMRALPVVVFTSSDEAGDLARSYSLGANSYVVKPADSRQFQETLDLLAKYWLQVNRYPVD